MSCRYWVLSDYWAGPWYPVFAACWRTDTYIIQHVADGGSVCKIECLVTIGGAIISSSICSLASLAEFPPPCWAYAPTCFSGGVQNWMQAKILAFEVSDEIYCQGYWVLISNCRVPLWSSSNVFHCYTRHPLLSCPTCSSPMSSQ